MSKPKINIPAEFAINGVKTPFSNAKIQDGFDRINPDVLLGDCLNKFIDDTYKGLNGVLELYEGCVLYDSTVTYTNKSLVFDITNDGIKFYHSLQNGNINHALTDADYWEEVNLGGSSRNVGEIIQSSLPLTDAGLHLLDGALISGSGSYAEFVTYISGLVSTYPDLFTTESNWQTSVTTYGVCGKFVYTAASGNDPATVRLPKITGVIEGTTDVTALGNLVEAGLPNITGTLNFYSGYKNSQSGAITYTKNNNMNNAGGGNMLGECTLNIDASLSNSIYGNSTTVQPQTIKVLYYIVIATTTKTSIQVDIDQVATDLNGKADVDLSNVSDSGTSLGGGWALPSGTYIDLTLGASNTTYTAPANGWVHVAQKFSGSGYYLGIAAVNTNSDGLCMSTTHSMANVYIPVNKNQTFKVYYDGTLEADASNRFVFIYAKGSESEA